MNKPDILYHASIDRDIKEFEPRNEAPRYSGESDLVFASPRKALAAMFLAPREVSIQIGIYDDVYVIFIESDESIYVKYDRGGAIYELPSDTFETDTKYGMGEIEWYSRTPVKPLAKTIYETSLAAMHQFGVKYYFVSHETMERIQQDPRNALQLVNQ